MSTISALSSLTRSEIARRSGVHRSTVYRVLDGSTDIRLETLEEIALALGFQASIRFDPLSDPAAADAARILLDAAIDIEPTRSAAAWMDRLRRFAGEDASSLEIALEAARASSLLARSDAIGMRGDFTVDRLASAGHAIGEEWALSGSAALESLDGEESDDHPLHVLWTSNPIHAQQLLSDTGKIAPRGLGTADLIIAAPSNITLLGAVDVEGIMLVSPVQAIIDSLGLRTDQYDRALSIAREW